MSQPHPPPPAAGPSAPPRSVRVRLARLALEAALAVPGVADTHAGHLGVAFTGDGSERLRGVVATAAADGAFAIELHLVAELVPLIELGDSVRAAVFAAASATGLAQALARADVRFEEVTAPAGTPVEAGV